jgi:hypothetical protein
MVDFFLNIYFYYFIKLKLFFFLIFLTYFAYLFEKEKWCAFKYNPMTANNYGLLEIINSTFIKWSFVYSNETVIDHLYLVKVNMKAFSL